MAADDATVLSVRRELEQVNTEMRRLQTKAGRLQQVLREHGRGEKELDGADDDKSGDGDAFGVEREEDEDEEDDDDAAGNSCFGQAESGAFANFRVTDPSWPLCALVKDFSQIACHFCRFSVQLSSSSASLASGPERRLLATKYSRSVMKQRLLINLFVWRRSALFLLLLSTIGVMCLAARLDIYMAHADIVAAERSSGYDMSHVAWRESAMNVSCETRAVTMGTYCSDIRNMKPLDYSNFTATVAKSVFYRLGLEVLWAQLRMAAFFIFIKLAACYFVLLATLHWANWLKSSRYITLAWLCTFMSPFVRSVVPMAAMINWEPITADLDRYITVTDLRFDVVRNIEHTFAKLSVGCQTDQVESVLRTSHQEIHQGCRHVNSLHHLFFWSSMLTKANRLCERTTEYMDRPALETALAEKKQLCEAIQSDRLLQNNFTLTSVEQVVDPDWISGSFYGLVGFASSLVSFPLVFAKALSVAPGLLTSALRIKVVIPQSYLAGVCIITMPILFVPMVCALCIFVIQSLGDVWLWAALNLLTLSTLAYTICGVQWRVTQPMSRSEVETFTRHVLRIVRLMRTLAMIFLLVYSIKMGFVIHSMMSRHEGITSFLMAKVHMHVLPFLMEHLKIEWLMEASLDIAEPVAYIIFSFWTGMYMTAIVGADWLLHASAEEWFLTHHVPTSTSQNLRQQTLESQERADMKAVCEVADVKEKKTRAADVEAAANVALRHNSRSAKVCGMCSGDAPTCSA